MTVPLTASLPMYAMPGTYGDWAQVWQAISGALRAAGFDAPGALHQPADVQAHWRDPDLILSQTCGMPYRLGLWRDTALIGPFDFGLPGCPPGFYRSALVARRDDRRDLAALLAYGRPAINSADSQSGFQALKDIGGRVADPVWSGGHARSAGMVAAGRADLAAIDAQTLRLLGRTRSVTGLRVAGWTPPTPGLPLITAGGRDAAAIGRAVAAGVARCPARSRRRLGLRGVVAMTPADYGVTRAG